MSTRGTPLYILTVVENSPLPNGCAARNSEITGPLRTKERPPTHSLLRVARSFPGGICGPVIASILPPFRVPLSSQKSPPSGSLATTFAGPLSASQLFFFTLRLDISAVQRL